MTTTPTDGEVLLDFARRIEALAFEMPAPNSYTPRFVEVAIAMRGYANTRPAPQAGEAVAKCEREIENWQNETGKARNELVEMEYRKNAAYLERNQVVAALAKCFPSGVARTAIEGWSEDWHGCVYIDLPTGQASWHFHDSHAYLFDGLPQYQGKWDGHTTEEKYARVTALYAAPQGVRDAVIEECAKICENLTYAIEISEWVKMTEKEHSAYACHECSKAIRALKSPAMSEGGGE